MLIIGLALITLLPPLLSVSAPVQKTVSLDWSGYIVVTDYTNQQPIVSSVKGSWIVPKVNVNDSPHNSFSAAWIGIGGQTDETLIQIGTEHDCINGMDTYSAWYEMLPNDSVTITTINVSPGDQITASMTLINPTNYEWSIQISDDTKGQVFQQNFIYHSSRLSAEWIVERPEINNRFSTLCDFGKIVFTDATVTMNTKSGNIGNFPSYMVTINDRQNNQLTSVSSLTSKGSSFTVNYL